MEDETKEAFLKSWRDVNSKSVIGFASEENVEDLPLPMQELARNYVECKQGKREPEMGAEFLESLHFNQEQCESIDRLTWEQSESSNWVEQ